MPTITAHDDDDDDDNRSRRRRLEDEQDREEQDRTEGPIVEVACNADRPYVLIAVREGLQMVHMVRERCVEAVVGDYLEADGVQEHELLFDADEDGIKLRRRGTW